MAGPKKYTDVNGNEFYGFETEADLRSYVNSESSKTSLERSTSSGGNPVGAGMKGMLENLAKERKAMDMQVEDIYRYASQMGGGFVTNRKETFSDAIDILTLTDEIRQNIVKSFGVGGGLMDDFVASTVYAAQEFEGFALTANDSFEVLSSTIQDLGRNIAIPPSALADLTKLEFLYEGLDAGQLVAEFDKIGMGTQAAAESTVDAIQGAQSLGAVTSKFLPAVTKEIEKINTYGFKNGVDGLAKMVAESQILGLNFGEVISLADKLYSPEAAVELAAELQMIGGAANEMLDPFQLMYMAQNDVEGLKDAIVETAQSAVQFNNETGQFEIGSPESRMRLKAQAEAMGMDFQDLANSAIKAKKRTAAITELGQFAALSEKDKELIASMADIGEGGEFQLTLGDETINFDNLEERMRQDTSLLSKIQEQSSMEQLSSDEQMNKTLEDQYTVSQSIESEVAAIQNILTEAAASGSLGMTAKELALSMKETVQGELSGQVDNVIPALKGFIQEDTFARTPPNTGSTNANDFVIRPGGSLEKFSEGSVSLTTNPNDTIVGGTNLFQETTNRISNMSNLMTTNNTGGRNTDTINVRVSFDKPLTMSLDGQLSNMKLSARQVERAMESTGFIQSLMNKTFQANGPVG
mgnify:CR=1 FL=1